LGSNTYLGYPLPAETDCNRAGWYWKSLHAPTMLSRLEGQHRKKKKDALSAQEVISGSRRHGYAQPRRKEAVQLKLFIDLIEQYAPFSA